MRKVRLALALAILLLPLACGDSPFEPTDPDNLVRTGTVRFMNIEGGFWAIAGDDGVTYDPLSPLAAQFQREGLRVRFEAKVRSDVGSTHMVGPIVEIIQIEKL
ncbi:MAG TPA: hypothetical protein VES67_09150 [Vicinamibacterales bacterium]|nr:hypothetical protein [Vicinamibacterales bacterium]